MSELSCVAQLAQLVNGGTDGVHEESIEQNRSAVALGGVPFSTTVVSARRLGGLQEQNPLTMHHHSHHVNVFGLFTMPTKVV